ncbi:hypothetical protein EG850_02270 [Gulosibacter macacae]|uniref:Uncharacterized protein n=1 Tax=Gulosibacter macacae TaxID=2488791 RepID=A0A3P3W1Q7_9MICO|nr:hypothetical protein [Gulosibacter macacae]RRJ88288.1 hypothetical protein EG850_02270 [Gulosibacter macacae]
MSAIDAGFRRTATVAWLPLSGGRWVALPALAGIAAHVWILLAHPHGEVLAAVMIAMTLVCSWCVVDLLARPSGRGLRMIVIMAAVMAVLHLGLIVGMPGALGSATHVHGAAAPMPALAPSDDGGMTAQMLGLIVIEIVIAYSAAFALRRRARVQSEGRTPTSPSSKVAS